jgi:pimeloyl-ACP methyl ester carboxylesterase
MNRPVVLIHGSPGKPSTWKGVIKELGDDVTVITPGLPDHNQPYPPRDRETAAMAAAIVDDLGPQPDGIVLGGHSYGGNVALQIALAGHVPVAALVLVEPVALKTLAALGEETAYADAKTALDSYVRHAKAGETDAIGMMIDFWFGPGAFTRMPDQLQGFLRSQTLVNVRDGEAAFRERYTRETLAALSAPVAVAYGTSSPAVSELIAQRLAATVKHGEAVPLDGADHGMLATHAPQLAELIRSTVARVTEGRRTRSLPHGAPASFWASASSWP